MVHLLILGPAALRLRRAQLVGGPGRHDLELPINNASPTAPAQARARLLVGYFKFVLLCSVPLAANVAVATMVYERGPTWWVAGVAGAVVAAVWNYITTSRAVW